MSLPYQPIHLFLLKVCEHDNSNMIAKLGFNFRKKFKNIEEMVKNMISTKATRIFLNITFINQ
jgi:hypothetical protein